MGKFRCKKGTKRNPDGSRKYWNKYKKKCQSSQQAASRAHCRPGTFRSQKSGRCKKSRTRKGVNMYN